MSYELRALVAQDALAEGLVARLAASIAVPLGKGLTLFPMAGDWAAPAPESVPAYPEFDDPQLTESLVSALADLSNAGPIAYIAIEEQSDLTWQAAVAWSAGRLQLLPAVQLPGAMRDASGGPVLSALRLLGAEVDPTRSDFGDFGLYRHRHTDEWRERPGGGEA